MSTSTIVDSRESNMSGRLPFSDIGTLVADAQAEKLKMEARRPAPKPRYHQETVKLTDALRYVAFTFGVFVFLHVFQFGLRQAGHAFISVVANQAQASAEVCVDGGEIKGGDLK